MNMYRFTKDRLISQGHTTDEVDLLAKDISIAMEIDKDMFQFFDDAANKLPWPQDRDFGATKNKTVTRRKKSSNCDVDFNR